MKALTCLVTGATSGIGQGLALTLAGQGQRVIVCCRSQAKADGAVVWLQERVPDAQLETLVADLGCPASVKAAIADFKDRFSQLDALCHMAGATFFRREVSPQGVEMNFAVNHLGPFQLTVGLLPALQAAEAGRIVTVSGEFHRKAELDFSDLEWQRRFYNPIKAGAAAMLMRVLFTRALSQRLAPTRVTANCFHPGAVRSGLTRKMPWPIRIPMLLAKPFMLSPEKGADTGAWLATSPEAAGVNGAYLIRRRVVTPGKAALVDASAQKLWDISEASIG